MFRDGFLQYRRTALDAETSLFYLKVYGTQQPAWHLSEPHRLLLDRQKTIGYFLESTLIRFVKSR